MNFKPKHSLPILSVLILLSNNVLASGVLPESNDDFKLHTQGTLWGFTGSHTFADGEIMVPFKGDKFYNFYGILEGGFGLGSSIESRFGGAGLGYRFLMNNNSRIMGFYALGDYLNSKGNNDFWFVNPGFESLGEIWDFRVNGYVPVSDRKKLENEENFFASERGLFDAFIAEHHTLYDTLIDQKNYDKVGYGLDVEVGRKFPKCHDLGVYVGAYGFTGFENDYQNFAGQTGYDHVIGGEARINVPLTNYATFEIRDGYDKEQHNSLVLGLKIAIGGIHNKEQYGISGRLMDPIEHNLAVASGWSAEGIPVQRFTEQNIIGRRVYLDHIAAFLPGISQQATSVSLQAGGEDGTFEHPFHGITPAIMDQIKNDPELQNYVNMFFSPGTYSLGAFTGPDGRIPLPANYSMYGRRPDFKAPAVGDQRALFLGGIDIDGGLAIDKGGDNFDSIRLLNDGSQTVGFALTGQDIMPPTYDISGITFNNVDVGVSSNSSEQFNNALLFNTLGNLTIGNISSSNFISNSQISFGLITAVNNLTVGNIINSTFQGGDFGFFTQCTGSVQLGNITNSTFTGMSGGFAASSASLLAQIGNITNSRFQALNNGRGFNFTGYDDVLGNIVNSTFQGANDIGANISATNSVVINGISAGSAFQGTTGMLVTANSGSANSIILGSIANSTFIGSTVGAGFIAKNLTLGDITNSSFTGTATSGFITQLTGNLAIGNIINSHFNGTDGLDLNATGSSTIGNITDSSFGGTSRGVVDISSGSLVAIGDISHSNFQGGEFGLLTTGTSTTSIGNIFNSIFSGTAEFGFYDVSGGGTSIGNISDSNFTGSNSLGFGGMALFNTGGNIVLGNISNSTFAGDTGALLAGNGNLTINNISESHFNGVSNGFSENFTGGNSTISSIDKSFFQVSGDSGNGFFALANNFNLLGDISDSTFTGGKIHDSGLVVQTVSNISLGNILRGTFSGGDQGAVFAGSGGLVMGNISSSTFAGGGGGFVSQMSTNIQMGNISNSIFTANAVDSFAFGVISTNVSLGNISNNTFRDTGTNSSGFAGFALTNFSAGNISGNLFQGTHDAMSFDGGGTFTLGTIGGSGISHNTFNYGNGASDYGIELVAGSLTIDKTFVDNPVNNTFNGNPANHISPNILPSPFPYAGYWFTEL